MSSRRLLPHALSVLALLASPALAFAQNGSVSCEVKENGVVASGTLTLLRGEAEVGSGTCGKPLAAAPGDYTAVIVLDGALDGPEQRKPVSVQAGKTATVSAEFSTGLLEVKIQSQGRDTAGMAVIRKNGKQIGTLGSGVTAHLSVGRYEVVARYRTQQKAFAEVVVTQGQTTVLDAAFE
jgi:hypothetical protein